MTKQKSTFVKGAMILAIANLFVKIIGAGFKIPLTWLIGDEGMGLFSLAFNLYALMFTITTAGFPIAISKMIAESLAKENEKEAKRIFVISLIVLGILGGIGSAVLYFGAHSIAELFIKDSRVAIGIMAISPAVLFVAIAASFRGYFQGRKNMVPTALANIMEAIGKLVIGYIAAFFMLRLGMELASISAGALYGVSFGTALAALLLFYLFLWQKRKAKPTNLQGKPNTRTWSSLAKELFIIAIPITLGACIQSLISTVDTLSITSRLQLIPGIDVNMASTMFGAYTTKAVTIFGLPLAIFGAFAIALVPTIASAIEKDDLNGAKRATNQILRMTSLFAVPCAVGVWALAEPILQTIYGINNIPDYAPGLLKIISLSIFLSAFVSVPSAILQAYGKLRLPVIFMIIGGIVKLAINWNLLPIWGISAAPVATNVCYFIIAALNLIAVALVVKIKFDIMGTLVKPLIASAFLAIVAIQSYSFIQSLIGVRLACLAAIALAGIAYLVILILTKGISKEDFAMIKKN